MKLQKNEAKQQLESLINEYCSLDSSVDKAAFSERFKGLLANQSEADRQAFVEAFEQGAKDAVQQASELIDEATLRLTLNHIYPYISWSYVALTYFGKSRSWLNQRLNGSRVNGKPVMFTSKERAQLIHALNDMGTNITQTALSIQSIS
jgi:hypothetical protein